MNNKSLKTILLEKSSSAIKLTTYLKNNSEVVILINKIFEENINNSKDLDLSTYDIKQKVWHFLNDNWNLQFCNICNHNLKRWYGIKQGWLDTCEVEDCGYSLTEHDLISFLKQKVKLQIKLQHFLKRRPMIIEKINSLYYSKINNIEIELKLDQKIWHIVNNVWEIEYCNMCKKLKGWLGVGNGWSPTCGKKNCRIAQIKATKQTLYGDENFNNRKKAEKTTLDNYGVKNVALIDSVKEKRKTTTLQRYGVEHTSMAESVKKKRSNSLKKLYTENPNIKKNAIQTFLKNRYADFVSKCDKKNVKLIDLTSNFLNCQCKDCKSFFEISRQMFNIRYRNDNIICNVCNPYYQDNFFSKLHKEISSFIFLNFSDLLIENTCEYISPKQLDVVIPSKNLAIEINGVYWHSELYRDDNYHIDKTNRCLEQGIKLIHIWEDDWKYKQEIVKSRILNFLNKTPTKIFARKCQIKEISAKESREFLNQNHLQGYVASSIKIGLFYQNELVSLMTFGRPRKSLNSTTNKKDQYEMYRFCSKLNVNVVGGASKLFKYFVNTYHPKFIVTYFDRSWGQSSVYKHLGFKFVKNTGVNYWYVIDGVKKHRFNYTKHKLVEKGYDPKMTEVEIMHSLNYYRLFGPGNEKWIWKF